MDKFLSYTYHGPLSVTANGRECQHWSSQSPHTHVYFIEDDEFPQDESVYVAKNYCRDQDIEGRTWCYTMDPDVVWEYCNFPPCLRMYLILLHENNKETHKFAHKPAQSDHFNDKIGPAWCAGFSTFV